MFRDLTETVRARCLSFGAWLDGILPLRRPRAGFRRWRRTRPYWGGILVITGGAAILTVPLAPLPVMIHVGMAATSGVAIGIILIVSGLFFWFAPQQRMFIAIVATVCSLASFVTSNLGGLGIGMLLGLIGSSMAFGWRPHPKSQQGRRFDQADQANQADRADQPPAVRHRIAERPLLLPGEIRGPRRTLAVLLPVVSVLTGAVVAAGSPTCPLPEQNPLTWLIPPWLRPSPAPTTACPPSDLLPVVPTPGPTRAPGPNPTGGPTTVPVPPSSPAAPGSSPAADPTPGASMTRPPPASKNAAVAEMFGANVPEVSADKLMATGFTFKGTTSLRSVNGPIQVLLFHADNLVAANYRIRTTDPGSTLRLAVDLDIDDVDIYATRLSGTVTVPYLDIAVLPITFTAELIPTWLPLNIGLPVFSGLDVTAGQVFIRAGTVGAKQLDARVTG